jgi:hypothetical protein
MSTLKRLLLAWVGLLVLILVIAQFIVTDSKRVNRVLQACEQSLRNADADGILANVARDYQYQDLSWETLREKASRIFRRSQFPTTIMRNKHIQIDGETADVKFKIFTQPAQGSSLPASSTAWRLRLDKRGKQWLVTEIELLTVDGRQMGTLKQVMELAEGMEKE